jgi:hypothetical protein
MVSAAFLPGTALAAESKDAISISSALQPHLIESSGSYVFERDIELPKGDAWQLPDDFTGSFSYKGNDPGSRHTI